MDNITSDDYKKSSAAAEAKQKTRGTKGKKKTGSQIEIQTFKPMTFRPFIATQEDADPFTYHEFLHDPESLDDMAAILARETFETVRQHFNQALDANVIAEASFRMTRLMLAKKLAFSLDNEASARFGADLGFLRGLEITIPEVMLPLVEGFGYFHFGSQDKGEPIVKFRMRDQVFHAISHFIHGVHTVDQAQQINAPIPHAAECFNINIPNWGRIIVDHFSHKYNTWAESTDLEVQIPMGQFQVTILPPVTRRGFGGILAFLGPNPNVPRSIFNAINILAIFEANANNQAFPGAADIQALQQFGLFLVNWTSANVKRQVDVYISEFEMMFTNPLVKKFKIINRFTDFSKSGAAWQLMNMYDPGRSVYPMGIPEADRQFGYMLSLRTYVTMRTSQVQTISSVAPSVARHLFIQAHTHRDKNY